MKTLRWYALPCLLTVTWFALATGTLIQFAALGGALAELDAKTNAAPPQYDVAAEPLMCVGQ